MTGVYSPGLKVFQEKDLEIHDKLGEGTYGTVHKVRETSRGKWMAVKKVSSDWFDYSLPPSTMREIATLVQLGPHPNVVSLEGVLMGKEGELLLCFELCRGGDLYDKLAEINVYKEHCVEESFGTSWAKHIVREISSGLHHLHRNGIVHRDLKPMNILTDETCKTIKLCDFGMARSVATKDRLLSREAMTTSYRAPEVALSSPFYGMPCDIWSAGLLFGEILTGKTMFDLDTEVELLMEIFKTLGTPSEATWPGLTALPEWNPNYPKFAGKGLCSRPGVADLCPVELDLLHEMIKCNPSHRITIQEVLSHPFLQ